MSELDNRFTAYRFAIARAARQRADQIIKGERLTEVERENAAVLIGLTEQMMDGTQKENEGFVRIRTAKQLLAFQKE